MMPPPFGMFLPNSGPPFATNAGFRECARCFAAEGILARSKGNYSAALQASLDAMELGRNIPKGGGIIPRLVGLACHAMGFALAERTVSGLPASAIPSALARVRRLRQRWPPLRETLESERVANMS